MRWSGVSRAAVAAALFGPALLAFAPGTPQARPGVWISRAEVLALPDEGPAWDALLSAARAPLPEPDLSDPDSDADVLVLARALVHARSGDEAAREQVLRAVEAAMGSEDGASALAVSRNLPGYVIAADLVGLPTALEQRFRAWLRELLGRNLEGGSIRDVHERRPNNWGTHAGGARAVVARYLGNERELSRVAQVFRGWLGERDAYRGFAYGELDWQADPDRPVGVNPRGATRDGRSIDGVLPDDQRRGGPFRWPPPRENYVYEALQGALLQAVVLSRAGHDPWSWGDRALLRAFEWLHGVAGFPAQGDDVWQCDVIDHHYGTRYATGAAARPGKSVGWTDWTLRGERSDASHKKP